MGLTQYTSLNRSTSRGGCNCNIQKVMYGTTSNRVWWIFPWISARAKGSVMFPLADVTCELVPAGGQGVLWDGAVGAPIPCYKYMFSLLMVRRHEFISFVQAVSFHLVL